MPSLLVQPTALSRPIMPSQQLPTATNSLTVKHLLYQVRFGDMVINFGLFCETFTTNQVCLHQ